MLLGCRGFHLSLPGLPCPFSHGQSRSDHVGVGEAALTAAEHLQPQAGVLQLANDMAISAGGWDTAVQPVVDIKDCDSWIEASTATWVKTWDNYSLTIYSSQSAAGLIARERELISKSLLAHLASLLFPCCASRTDPLAFVDVLHCSS